MKLDIPFFFALLSSSPPPPPLPPPPLPPPNKQSKAADNLLDPSDAIFNGADNKNYIAFHRGAGGEGRGGRVGGVRIKKKKMKFPNPTGSVVVRKLS